MPVLLDQARHIIRLGAPVAGTDCTEEVLGVHSILALKQLQPYMIGELKQEQAACKGDNEE